MDQTNPDLLKELEQEIYLEPASQGARFANYIIDLIFFYAFMFALGALLGVILYSQDATMEYESDSFSDSVLEYLIAVLLIVIYYTLLEGLTKGRTIGKMITGTVAVKEDGSPLTVKEAFLRSLCRIIPFEPFSGLGARPWHDSITKTFVVKKSK